MPFLMSLFRHFREKKIANISPTMASGNHTAFKSKLPIKYAHIKLYECSLALLWLVMDHMCMTDKQYKKRYAIKLKLGNSSEIFRERSKH